MEPATVLAEDLVATLLLARRSLGWILERRFLARSPGVALGGCQVRNERRVDQGWGQEVRFARVERKVAEAADILGASARKMSLCASKGRCAMSATGTPFDSARARNTHMRLAEIDGSVLLHQLGATAAVQKRDLGGAIGKDDDGFGGRCRCRDGGGRRGGEEESCRGEAEGEGAHLACGCPRR